MDAAITGWAHTRFGRLDDETAETLIGRVAEEALDHAGLDATEVDAVFVGTFNEGFSPQGFPSTLASLRVGALRHAPAVRLENACATGSAASTSSPSTAAKGACPCRVKVTDRSRTDSSGSSDRREVWDVVMRVTCGSWGRGPLAATHP